eukprot:7111709-Pyramimonas_sp.AAC.1
MRNPHRSRSCTSAEKKAAGPGKAHAAPMTQGRARQRRALQRELRQRNYIEIGADETCTNLRSNG